MLTGEIGPVTLGGATPTMDVRITLFRFLFNAGFFTFPLCINQIIVYRTFLLLYLLLIKSVAKNFLCIKNIGEALLPLHMLMIHTEINGLNESKH
jgi:hypothetical protein